MASEKYLAANKKLVMAALGLGCAKTILSDGCAQD
jgi:hypothetical protein